MADPDIDPNDPYDFGDPKRTDFREIIPAPAWERYIVAVAASHVPTTAEVRSYLSDPDEIASFDRWYAVEVAKAHHAGMQAAECIARLMAAVPGRVVADAIAEADVTIA